MEDVREGVDVATLLVNAVQTRYLDEPPNVVAKEFVVDNPFGELVPLRGRAAVDADSPFAVLPSMSTLLSSNALSRATYLVLALFQICHNL